MSGDAIWIVVWTLIVGVNGYRFHKDRTWPDVIWLFISALILIAHIAHIAGGGCK